MVESLYEGGRVRDREGLRGNEGAYYVDKEIENGRGRGRGDLAFYTHPPTHTCLYVRTYITSQCAPSKLFLYMFPPSFLHHMFLVLGKLCTYEMTRTHTSTCKPRSLTHYMYIRKHIHIHLHILLHIHMVEGEKCILTLNKPQMCINLVSGMQNFSHSIYNSIINKIQRQKFGTKRSVNIYASIVCVRGCHDAREVQGKPVCRRRFRRVRTHKDVKLSHRESVVYWYSI